MKVLQTVLCLWLGLVEIPAGTISGFVKFEGEKPPPPRELTEINANSFCKAACKGKLPVSDRYVFGKKNGTETLANVLVYVSKGLEGKEFQPPQKPVVIDQVDCIYTPHVSAAMVGQPVHILNSDATLHNVMSRPKKNKTFNDGMPGKGPKLVKVFDQPELGIDLRCFMHPWMLGYIHILDHPFFAVTAPDGTFKIDGLPPGEYELSVYHEYSRFKAEPATISVKVDEDAPKETVFTYTFSRK